MKSVMSVNVDVELIAALKERAHEQRISASRLAEQLLREGLGKPQASAKPAEALPKKAQIVLDAIDALVTWYAELPRTDPTQGNTFFPLHEIVKKAGLYPSEARGGLRELERRGIIRCDQAPDLSLIVRGVDAPLIEHWGRKSQSRTPGAHPQHTTVQQ